MKSCSRVGSIYSRSILIPWVALLACAPGVRATGPRVRGSGAVPFETADKGDPTLYWISEPVLAGETVLACGSHLDAIGSVHLRGAHDENLDIVQKSPRNIAFRLPARLPTGPVQLQVAGDRTMTWTLNGPDAYWAQAVVDRDHGNRRTLRIFGRCLATDEKSTKVTIGGPGGMTPLTILSASTYEVDADLPPSIGTGDHAVKLVATGSDGTSAATEVSVSVDDASPKDAVGMTLNEKSDGKSDMSSLIQADLTKVGDQGGGIVRVPAGRYLLLKPISVPTGVSLVGDSEGKTTFLFDSREESLPLVWITLHRRSSLSQMSVVANNYHFGIRSGTDGDDGEVLIDHVRMRFLRYSGMSDIADIEKRMDEVRKYPSGRGDAVLLSGSHCEISHCDVYCSDGVTLDKANDVWVHDTTIGNGAQGWSRISGVRNMIFERNVVEGVDSTASAGLQLKSPRGFAHSENLCLRGNTLRSFYGHNREAFTSDSPGGLFSGLVTGSNGAKLSVDRVADANDDDWIGAGVFVMDGTGAGQYRRVSKITGGEIEIDQPWTTPLDRTSSISIAPLLSRLLVLDNKISESGTGIQFYGSSVDVTLDGNEGQRVETFANIGRAYGKGGFLQPSWYIQWLGNSITGNQDFVYHAHRFYLAASYLGAVSAAPASSGAVPTMTAGTVMRHNFLADGAYILVGKQPPLPITDFDGAVIEDNAIDGADVGIQIDGHPANVYMRGNQTPNCGAPIKYDPPRE